GAPLGFTANSFSSVSLEQPMVQVIIALRSTNHADFAGAKTFAVNVLSEAQRDVSTTFSRPVPDRFAAVDWWQGSTGCPIFEGVSAWFDCTMFRTIEAGDHTILIGKVQDFHATALPGLGYGRGAYLTPARTEPQTLGPDVVITAIIERGGAVLLTDDGMGGMTLPSVRAGREGAQIALAQLLDSIGTEAEPGPVYAVYEDVRRGSQTTAFRCPSGAGGDPNTGQFVPLDPNALGDVTDPALRTMLERLAAERQSGNFGIYFGDQDRGQVARVAEGQA
ncbi:MAG: flavin reductase family protein, partial [Rubellimicrobium sp.]|nr:flavin reductase family protein [Rubellimicrobium sp.]